MHSRTRRLGLVDAATCDRLLAEALQKKFFQHAPGKFGPTGPLRHGATAHIRELGSREDAVYQDNLHDFPAFKAFLAQAFHAEKVGKSYWHRLSAGKTISRHIDCSDYYERTHRFQLFPSMDDGHVALIDGVEERFASRTLLAFDPSIPHAYENRSSRECVFLVFDLYPGQYRLP